MWKLNLLCQNAPCWLQNEVELLHLHPTDLYPLPLPKNYIILCLQTFYAKLFHEDTWLLINEIWSLEIHRLWRKYLTLIIHLRQSRHPIWAAACRGAIPSPALARRSPPDCLTRCWSTSKWPSWAARYTGLTLLSSRTALALKYEKYLAMCSTNVW